MIILTFVVAFLGGLLLWSLVLAGSSGGGDSALWRPRRHAASRRPDPAATDGSVALADAALALRRAGCDDDWLRKYVMVGIETAGILPSPPPQAFDKGRTYLGMTSQQKVHKASGARRFSGTGSSVAFMMPHGLVDGTGSSGEPSSPRCATCRRYG